MKEAKERKKEVRYKVMMMKTQKENRKKRKTAGVNRRQQKQKRLEMQTNARSTLTSTCQAGLY